MPMQHGACVFLHHAPSRRVLLQHRTDDAPSYPGCWGMFGGGGEAEDDGDPVRTLQRELHEELGVALDAGQIVRLWAYLTSQGSHRYVFLYPWDDPDYPFIQTEGQGRGWFTIEEALRTLTLTDNTRRDLTLLDNYFRRMRLDSPSPACGGYSGGRGVGGPTAP